MKKKNSEDIISELKTIYGNYFDYSKLVYNGSKEKFCLNFL